MLLYINMSNNITEHVCKLCNKKFSTKYTLINHNLKNCLKTTTNTSCNKCKKVFSSKYTLQNHNLKNCIGNTDNTDNTDNTNIINNITEHKCNICYKKFSTKYTLHNHTLRKCENIYIQIDGKYKCNMCNKIYSSKLNLKYHILKTCNKNFDKIKITTENNELKNKVNELENIIEDNNIMELKNKITKLENRIKELEKIIEDNNIKIDTKDIVTFGLEDVSKLSIEERGQICSSGPSYFVKCLTLLHFNENIPEYQNIKITNLRGNTGKIYVNSKWIDYKMDTVLNNVINNINKKCKEMFDLPFPDNIRQNRINFTKDYVTGKELLSGPMSRREDVKICIYNETKLLQ